MSPALARRYRAAMRTHLVIATATLASGLLALNLPMTARADQPHPVIDIGSRAAAAVQAPTVTVHKAGTTTTVGQTAMGGTCPANASALTSKTGAAPVYTTPAGVITSYSFQGNATAGQIQVVLFGPETTPGNRSAVAKSAKSFSVPNVLNTFPTRVPVTAGMNLGVWTQAANMPCAFTGGVGDEIQVSIGDPDVSPVFSAAVTITSGRANISAVVESDGDGDGFGDVTQDLCPESAKSHDTCPAPDTTVGKAPEKSSTKRKAKITFSSTIAASTFTCSVDKKAAEPCTSPFKKTYKVGKHTVVITAVSPAGIVDPTPVTVKFKVTKPRR
jgi:hypothetical protein